ncbi:MAG TPA: LysM peptidoglycan-binding domain-containing protein [Limnochordia bacterium]|nr:LysM peptidoglycan-binding domain-containing protein [Limnochordia bacterium]
MIRRIAQTLICLLLSAGLSALPAGATAARADWSPFDPPAVSAEEASAPLSVVAGEAYGWPIVSYWVNPGDTLYSVATAHHTSVAYLERLNPAVVDAHLMVGQQLLTPSQTPDLPAQTYKIKAGDTLYSIARLYNTEIAVLEELNNISDPTTLHVGSTLLIRD